MSTPLVLIVIGIIMIALSAVWNPPGVSFWNLGWAFVLSGALVPLHGGLR